MSFDFYPCFVRIRVPIPPFRMYRQCGQVRIDNLTSTDRSLKNWIIKLFFDFYPCFVHIHVPIPLNRPLTSIVRPIDKN